MIRCGTLDTGEFIEGFCQYPRRIEHWNIRDKRRRFGKITHHVNKVHFDDRPENRMTCHCVCHVKWHHKPGNSTGLGAYSYKKLLMWIRTGIQFSEMGWGKSTLNDIYHNMLDGVDVGSPKICKGDLEFVLKYIGMAEKNFILQVFCLRCENDLNFVKFCTLLPQCPDVTIIPSGN